MGQLVFNSVATIAGGKLKLWKVPGLFRVELEIPEYFGGLFWLALLRWPSTRRKNPGSRYSRDIVS